MCIERQIVRLLESLCRQRSLGALLAEGVAQGCWLGARWRESNGALTAEAGDARGPFQATQFSLGWLETHPAADEALLAGLQPFLESWLEGHLERATAPAVGCWIDFETARFVSVLDSVEKILGLRVADFLALPVPQAWLDAVSGSPRGRSILYFTGGEGKPVWLDASWTRGSDPRQAWLVARDVSERHTRAEGWQQLEENAPTGLWELDLGTGRGWWSPQVAEIHGLPPDTQPTPELSLRHFPEPARLQLEAAVEKASRTGDPYDLELPMVTAQGAHRWIRTTGFAIYDGEQVTRLKGLFKDVTDQTEARRELKRERDRLRAMLDTIPDLIWLKTPDGHFLECNTRFQALLGAPREGVLGKTDYDFVPKALADFFRQHDLQALQAASPRRNEEWVTFADGHEELLETIKGPLYEEGRLVGVLGIGRDLTQNYNDRQQLQVSQARLRMFLENAPAAMAMFDRDMRYLLVSRRFVGDYGLVTDELVGRCHYDLFPKLPARWRQAHQRCLEGHVVSCDEDCYQRPDGTQEWVRWAIHPWYEDEGKVGGLILFSEVITAAKEAEAALRQSEEKLRVAQRMEAMGRLAGGVAHDFNNLLTVIVSCGELACQELSPEDEIYEDIQEILAASKRAESLTRQLLTFSRRQVTTLQTLDWSQVVSGLIRMLGRLIGEDVKLTFRSEEEACWVLADRGQLEQVVMNLAVNARDAMVSGGELSLELDNLDLTPQQADALGLTGGPHVRLRVADSGCGMDEETRQKMFEPFFTTKGLGKGTGLGLATVYGIVQQGGGGIEVSSRLGRGTTIDVYLPAHQPPQEAEPAVEPIAPTSVGSKRIMVIEDEAALRSVLKRVLQTAGFEVSLAADSEEALTLAQEANDSFDLILSDVILPGMNGCELMEHLRPLCPRAQHLFMSGYTDDVLERFAIPREKVLLKPFDWRVLTRRIQGILV
ncbi:MAG: PAS domain-containing protein [Vulcanimicrobiota bacterium]